MIGVPFGDGIYPGFLFLALWIADVVWLWSRRLDKTHFPQWRWLIHGYLFFIAFNGAIVFEGGPTHGSVWRLASCSPACWENASQPVVCVLLNLDAGLANHSRAPPLAFEPAACCWSVDRRAAFQWGKRLHVSEPAATITSS